VETRRAAGTHPVPGRSTAMLSGAVGLWLASRLGLRKSVAVFVVTELILLVWVRDSLLLNIVESE
jgi:hypothetical protein